MLLYNLKHVIILLNEIKRSFIIIYNAFQVVLSAYLFLGVRALDVEKHIT